MTGGILVEGLGLSRICYIVDADDEVLEIETAIESALMSSSSLKADGKMSKISISVMHT